MPQLEVEVADSFEKFLITDSPETPKDKRKGSHFSITAQRVNNYVRFPFCGLDMIAVFTKSTTQVEEDGKVTHVPEENRVKVTLEINSNAVISEAYDIRTTSPGYLQKISYRIYQGLVIPSIKQFKKRVNKQ